MIPQEAINLTIECEVSSRSYYEKRLRRPEWPGGASGVTVAIGYDLGYASLAKFHGDWDGMRPTQMLRAMEGCLGVRGNPARALLPSVRGSIDVPWDIAIDIFMRRDVPEWEQRVLDTLPGAATLHPLCRGALFSLAYNRGTSWAIPAGRDASGRYREMRQIKGAIADGRPEDVPALIRSMKRLWPKVAGLRSRREAEARLFERGLSGATFTPASLTTTTVVTPKRQLPPPPAGAGEHGTAGVVAAGTAQQAHDAASSGMPLWQVALIVGGGLAVAAIVWLAVRSYRKSQPVLARTKDHPQEG